MKNTKIKDETTKFELVKQYLSSSQSQTGWCKEHGIAQSTFSKWVTNYNSQKQDIQFIPLESKSEVTTVNETQSSVLIEIGNCKFHIPISLAKQLLEQALEVKL